MIMMIKSIDFKAKKIFNEHERRDQITELDKKLTVMI